MRELDLSLFGETKTLTVEGSFDIDAPAWSASSRMRTKDPILTIRAFNHDCDQQTAAGLLITLTPRARAHETLRSLRARLSREYKKTRRNLARRERSDLLHTNPLSLLSLAQEQLAQRATMLLLKGLSAHARKIVYPHLIKRAIDAIAQSSTLADLFANLRNFPEGRLAQSLRDLKTVPPAWIVEYGDLAQWTRNRFALQRVGAVRAIARVESRIQIAGNYFEITDAKDHAAIGLNASICWGTHQKMRLGARWFVRQGRHELDQFLLCIDNKLVEIRGTHNANLSHHDLTECRDTLFAPETGLIWDDRARGCDNLLRIERDPAVDLNIDDPRAWITNSNCSVRDFLRLHDFAYLDQWIDAVIDENDWEKTAIELYHADQSEHDLPLTAWALGRGITPSRYHRKTPEAILYIYYNLPQKHLTLSIDECETLAGLIGEVPHLTHTAIINPWATADIYFEEFGGFEAFHPALKSHTRRLLRIRDPFFRAQISWVRPELQRISPDLTDAVFLLGKDRVRQLIDEKKGGEQ